MHKGDDRYPEIGPKYRVDADEVLPFIRKHFPTAHAEGSTGPERTWWVPDLSRDVTGVRMVAHSFPATTRWPQGDYFVRIEGGGSWA